MAKAVMEPVEPADPDTEEPKYSFSTYLDYVRLIEQKWPEYAGLGIVLARNLVEPISWKHTRQVTIRDIKRDGTFAVAKAFSFEYVNSMDQPVANITTSKELKNALSACAEDVRTRFVLVTDDTGSLDSLVVDAIGLALDVEPLFFASIMKGNAPKDWLEVPSRHPGFLRMGRMWMKVLRDVGTSALVPPVCLVVSQYEAYNPHAQTWTNICKIMSSQRPSLYDQSSQWTVTDLESHNVLLVYERMLCRHRIVDPGADMVYGLNIMASIHLILFQSKLTKVSKAYQSWQSTEWENSGWSAQETDDRFYAEWRVFHTELEDFRSSLRAMPRFINSHFSHSKDSSMLKQLVGEQIHILTEAKTLETDIRKTLQINAGRLSLEESRRSIEEGKRVKLLTVLASAFIPISLASSIFGMNVQEINDTGKSIWTFAVTAVGLICLALTLWWLSSRLIYIRRRGQALPKNYEWRRREKALKTMLCI